MAEDKAQGCVEPAGGPILPKVDLDQSESSEKQGGKERMKMGVTVGQEAPDFQVSAYYEGGFKNIKLSDFRGKWVFLCFYPGDFTFV
jgi:peroxiredoxin (alkyl hydroperoxide reductase subunit C)